MSNALLVNNANFDVEVMQESKLTIVKFGATWCGPCKKMDPIIDEIAKENPSVKVTYIDIDSETILPVKYGVMSVPTMLFFKGGKVMDTIVGLVPKAKVLSLIEKHQ